MGEEQMRGVTTDDVTSPVPRGNQHRHVAAHRMSGIHESLYPFDGQPGDLFHFLRVVHNDSLNWLPVAPRGSVPSNVENPLHLLLRYRIFHEVLH